ncbi:spermidine N1-acetyltransferase [Escherichia coli]|uniref:Spermidine N1-acetyltransferase n=1 Tax=Escherichia coli TaxID=562 RepID=A0A484X6I4_ECOLX|nr:spermidine N1-acetyltransferase [Escherichia coli]
MPSAHSVKLRPLEREDLRYVHQLDNNASVMRYWFEEPTKPLLNSLICMISIFTIRANGALWWNVTAKKPVWWSWWKLTMFIAAQNFR